MDIERTINDRVKELSGFEPIDIYAECDGCIVVHHLHALLDKIEENHSGIYESIQDDIDAFRVAHGGTDFVNNTDDDLYIKSIFVKVQCELTKLYVGSMDESQMHVLLKLMPLNRFTDY